MKKHSFKWSGRLLRNVLPVVVAALSLSGVKAAHALDINVSHSGTDHTAAIQAALNNPAYSRVILNYYSSGWTSGPLFMNTPNQELWIKGSGSTPGKLTAKRGYPNFSATSDCLIRVIAAGCTINGYSNGVDKTSGIATLKMWKADYIAANGYTLGEHRMTIRTNQNNTTIKGVNLYASGGDGIYINGGSGSIVKDVIVDSANRNGISVIKADSLQIRDSTFKSTYGATTGAGAGPWAGIDFEPNGPTDNLTNITLHNCIFSGNAGDNILFALSHLSGPGVGSTIGVYAYHCISDNAGESAIQLAGMQVDGPALGQVYWQDTTFSNSEGAGIKIRQWTANRARITFNRMDMTHCADTTGSSPIYLEDGSPVTDNIGHIEFVNGCYVDDYNPSHQNILRGTAYGPTVFKSIVGQIYYRRNYTVSTPTIFFTGSGGLTTNNVTVAFTPY